MKKTIEPTDEIIPPYEIGDNNWLAEKIFTTIRESSPYNCKKERILSKSRKRELVHCRIVFVNCMVIFSKQEEIQELLKERINRNRSQISWCLQKHTKFMVRTNKTAEAQEYRHFYNRVLNDLETILQIKKAS